MLSSPRRGALLGSLALMAVVGTGCGGDDAELPEDPPDVFLERSLAESPVRSGEAQIGIESEAALAQGVPIVAELKGPFEFEPGSVPRFDLEYEAEAAGFGVDGELISTGEDAFVTFFGENYRVGPERVAEAGRRIEAAAAATGGEPGTPAALGLDPASWFIDPRYEGTQEIGGTETARVAGTLNEDAFINDVTEAAEAAGFAGAVEGIATSPIGDGSLEASIGIDDETLRRFQVDAPGTLFFEIEFPEVGTDPTIEPPPGGGFQPIEDLIGRLRSFGL